MLSNKDNANLDKDLTQMSRNVCQVDKSLLHAASKWIAEQQELERNFQRQKYEQHLRTQQHRQPARFNPIPHSTMAIQTRLALGQNITVAQKQPSQMELVEKAVSPIPKPVHEKTAHVNETEQLKKTIEQTNGELASEWISEQQERERNFQRQTYGQHLRTQQHRQPARLNLIPNSSETIQTRQDLGQNITEGQRQSSQMTLVEKAVSPLPKPAHEKTTQVKETEQLEKTIEQTRGELEPGMDDIRKIDRQVSSSSRDTLDLQSNEESANSDKDLKQMSRKDYQQYKDHLEEDLTLKVPRSTNHRKVQPTFPQTKNMQSFQSLTDAVTKWMAEQQQLERNFQRQTYEQQLRTQQHPQPARDNLRHSSMTIQPRQNITEGQKQSSQMSIVEKVVSPLPNSNHEKITYMKEAEQLEKTIEQRGDLEFSMDSSRGFDTQVNNTSRETCDLQFQNERVHSAQDQELPLMHAVLQWIAEQQEVESSSQWRTYEQLLLTQQHPQPARLNIPHSSMTIQTRQALGQNITEAQKQSSLVSLVEKAVSPLPKSAYEKPTHVNETEQLEKTIEQTRGKLEPEMDRICRMNTRFSSTSYDIFALQSYEDSENSWTKLVPDISDDQPFFSQPKEELSPQRVADPFDASSVVHQQLENQTQQQSYQQSILTRESPKFAGLELPHLTMAMQTPQPLNTTDSQKSSQMNLVQQSTPLSEPRHISMADIVNVEQVEKTFERKRTDLDTDMDGICSFDTPGIISTHDAFNLPFYENSLDSEEELSLVSAHDKRLITPAHPKQGPIEMPDDGEIQQFVETFKKRRFELGFTQKEAALAISRMVNAWVSPLCISRFENSSMDIKSMYSYKSVLQLWLENIGSSSNIRNPNPSKTYSHNTPELIDFRQRLNKTFDVKAEIFLEKTFLENKRPTAEKIDMIAESLNLSKYRVRVWFRNRRKMRNIIPTGLLVSSYSDVATPGFGSPVMVPPSSSVNVRKVSSIPL